MLKKYKGRVVICIVLALALILGITTVAAPDASRARVKSGERLTELSANNWFAKSNVDNGFCIDNATLNGTAVSGSFDFNKGDIITFVPPETVTGEYLLGMKYRSESAKAVDTLLNVEYSGESVSALVQLMWADNSSDYRTDRFGNEISNEQKNYPYSVFSPLFDKRSINLSPLCLDIKSRGASVTVINKTQTFIVEEIWLYKQTKTDSYESYLAKHKSNEDSGSKVITVEGENFSLKSDSYIHSSNVNQPEMHPYNTYKRLINVLDGGSFESAGQKVMWEFEVEKSGWYELGFNFCQNSASNKKSYRTVEIDGAIPFSELSAIEFEQTSDQEYVTKYVADSKGKSYKFYLEKGRHTLALRATLEPVEKIYNELLKLNSDMNDLGSDITKLTAGVTDKNRTWDLNVYLPNAIKDMKSFKKRLQGIYDELCELEGKKATYADSLLYAVDLLDNLLDSPRTIPNRMDLFNTGDGSAVKYISTVISNVTRLSLGIDQIYFKGLNAAKVSESVSVWTKIANSVKKFLYSLTPEASAANYATGSDSESLKVWVSRSSVYVQVLQSMVDSEKEFKDSPIDVSIMPSEQKLVLAAASGTNPDVVLGAGYTTPFKFALRGAALDLTEFSDFLPFYNKEYQIEGLIPSCYDGGVYGAIETQDYNVMFYRTDILDTLGIKVPQTWDEVKSVMPTLLRYNKNFSLPIANVVGYKSFATTSPYIYQHDGEFYSDGGKEVAFLSENTLNGFTELTDLFKIYSIDEYA